jgi:ketosteroid isomerase-like protein
MTTALETVREAYAAFARGDSDGFVDLFAPDAVIEQWDGVPWGGRADGIAAIREFVATVGTYIHSRAEADELYVSGDDIVAIGRSRGTAVRTGAPFDIRIVHVWRARDGKIVYWRLLVETAPLLAALAEEGSGR